METRHSRMIREIAESGRVSVAAERLGIGQSALSKIVRRIEDEFGVPIFDRGPKGATLTPFGRLFLDYANVLERETSDLATIAQSIRKGKNGRNRIGAGQTWMHEHLPDVFATVHAQRPDLSFSISAGSAADLIAKVTTGQLDLAFASITGPISQDLCVEELTHGQLHVVARQGHPLTKLPQAERFGMMMEYGWVAGENSKSDLTWEWLSKMALKFNKPRPNVVVETYQKQLVVEVLKRSDLLGFQPKLSPAVKSGELSLISELRVRQKRSTGMIWHRKHVISPGLAFIMSVARNLIADGEDAAARQDVTTEGDVLDGDFL